MPIGPTAKLLMLPLLFYHFERSTRGMWVFIAFLVSCTLLMAMSWIVVLDPSITLKKGDAQRGIFVKNYIDQSQEFALCAVALAYPIITFLRRETNLAGSIADRGVLELRRQHGAGYRVADGAGLHADHAGRVRGAPSEMAE